MKMKILNKEKEEIVFEIEDIKIEMANALRRIMISEVPILSIEEVFFKENNSALYDEVITHRLGLMPIKFPVKTFNFKEECENCEGEGCPNCQVVFTLEKEGPCTVYSGDMKSSIGEVKPAYDKIPIVKLEKGQKISFDAIAVLGRGKDHIKNKAAIASYKYYPSVNLDGRKCDNCGACVDICPKDIFKKGKTKPSVKNQIDCILCGACVEACGEKEAIEVSRDNKKLIFKVETVSGLSPKEIVLEACNILENKSEELKKEL